MQVQAPVRKSTWKDYALPALVTVVIVAVLGAAFVGLNRSAPPSLSLKRFTSEAEIASYLGKTSQSNNDRTVAGSFSTNPGTAGPEVDLGAMGFSDNRATAGAPAAEYTGTNVQVAGVDEPDVVKTDGGYLYIVSGGNVVIAKARPVGDAQVTATIVTESWSTEIYIDGDRLVVLTHGYRWYEMGGGLIRGGPACDSCGAFAPEVYPYESLLRVYDVSDHSAPSLLTNVSLPGWTAGSRLLGGWAYVLVTEYLWVENNDVVMPTITIDGTNSTLAPGDIAYFDDGTYSGTLLTVFALDVQNTDDLRRDSYLINGVGSLYVSEDNLYVTATTYNWERSDETVTVLHRIAIGAGKIAYEASGTVPGWVLGQYAMDQHEDHFRVATSAGWGGTAANGVYVLGMDMKVTGKIEGIAPGERIFSTRFLGDRGYLVTFRQVDPFFVLDLSNPAAPAILGELTLPGVSTYLHPYDDTHIIGLGTGTCDINQTWNGCVKLSLFDVTDPAHPVETSSYVVAATGGSWSEAQYDPKAFLFSADEHVLVIPIQTWSWATIEPSPSPGNETRDYFYSGWSGAYVFDLTAAGGFSLRGQITHVPENTTQDGSWYYGPSVRRSIIMKDLAGTDLYTVSDRLVKINTLATLAELKAVPLA